MPTTVQVHERTRRLLDRLKKEMALKSYDEVIRKLVEAKRGIPESYFASCEGSLPFEREKESEHAL